ncbi:MAG: peptidylprolyl isomerase [Bacteroidales bacterium]|nr:peptidylprolyl isomerase [Bacteroidales bacterium]
MKKYFLLIAAVVLLTACSEKADKVYFVRLTTKHGDIKIKLYNETPGHRDNFLELVKAGFYDDILFHRIIEGFMIQAGNPQTRSTYVEGSDISKYRYTIPAEIVPGLYHKKGAVAAARTGDQGNPLRASSGTQFYIVQGVIHDEESIIRQEERINKGIRDNLYFRYMAEEKAISDSAGLQSGAAEIQERATLRMHAYFEDKEPYVIPEEQRAVYATQGGAPHLDMNYTVFGEVVEGLDIIDKIAAEPRDKSDKPLAADVRIIKAEIVKK